LPASTQSAARAIAANRVMRVVEALPSVLQKIASSKSNTRRRARLRSSQSRAAGNVLRSTTTTSAPRAAASAPR
jgi:hypothetical protein